MTTTAATSRTRHSASQAVTDFFAAYGRHDVETMADMCTDNADFSYIPFEAWGKQRVIRGDGKVRTVGKVLWTGLINSFPDLFNQVHTVDANDDGDVVVTCDIGGTQQVAWGFIAAQGRAFSEPHLFIFHVDEAGLIDKVKAYWDGAGFNRQLGHVEVD
jgi:ketosteroid isomerase-like protein